MQLLNNLRQPGMVLDPKNRLKNIAILFFAGVIILALIVGFSHKKTTPNTKNEYVDKGSGETVSNPIGKVPESYGSTVANPILFLGFSKLLSHGILIMQHDEIKLLLQQYSDNNKAGFKELSLATDSILVSTPDIESGGTETVVTGQITANRTQVYDMELNYSRITTVRLVLKKEGKIIYDSGVIDTMPGAAEVAD